MPRRFYTLDVFTGDALAGNPLAVVLDSDGLDLARMQAIAKEFNLSETVFVQRPTDPRQRADIRIFTPGRELPFAGHPTVGTAVLLAILDRSAASGAVAFGLKEQVGIVPCVAEVEDAGRGHARFRLPRLPESWGDGIDAVAAAAALGLDASEIGFSRHRPTKQTGGVPYDLVPVASLDAVARAKPQGQAFDAAFAASSHPAAYVYTRIEGPDLRFRARMFAPGLGISEDPATGSAAASFAGALMQFEAFSDGEHDIVIEQGFEMGRPSVIALQLVVRNGTLASAEIGGQAVVVSRGELLV